MNFKIMFYIFLIIIASFSPYLCGLEFDDFFPESMGLGGAYTAVLQSPISVFYNPASLYYYKDATLPVYYLSVSYGKNGYESGDFLSYTNRISGIISKPYGEWSRTDVQVLSDTLREIKEKNPSLYGSGGYSFLISKGGIAVYFIERNLSEAIYDVDIMNIRYASADISDSILNNATRLEFHGLNLREYCISYSGILDDDLFFGATFRFITANSYYDHLGLFGLNEVYGNNLRYYMDNSFDENRKESSNYTFDMGLLAKLGPWGLLGFTAKNLRKIEFEGADKNILLKPQYRIGFTLILSDTSFITLDRDLTRNETIISEHKSQKLSIGLQKSFWADTLVLRAGARKDSKSRDSSWRYYLGSGLRLADYIDLQGAFHYNSADDSFAYNWGINLAF